MYIVGARVEFLEGACNFSIDSNRRVLMFGTSYIIYYMLMNNTSIMHIFVCF